MSNTCDECEYLGDAYIPFVDFMQTPPKHMGFEAYCGSGVSDKPARHCEHEKMKGKITTSSEGDACAYFKPRTWLRPPTCGMCDLKGILYTNGKFSCAGHPFCNAHDFGDEACINGKMFAGQAKLF